MPTLLQPHRRACPVYNGRRFTHPPAFELPIHDLCSPCLKWLHATRSWPERSLQCRTPALTKVQLVLGVLRRETASTFICVQCKAAEEARVAEHSSTRPTCPWKAGPPYDQAVQTPALFGSRLAAAAIGKLITAQSLGGTGSLNCADFLIACWTSAWSRSAIRAGKTTVRLVRGQRPVFESGELPINNPTTLVLDLEACCRYRSSARGSVVCLHACLPNTRLVADLSFAELDPGNRRGSSAASIVPFLDIA